MSFNTVKTAALLALLSAVLILGGGALAGDNGMYIGLAIAPRTPPPRLSRREPPSKKKAKRASRVMAAARVAATELIRISRWSTWPNSWATTPSISWSFIIRRMPEVNATEACLGLRPVAKALGESSGMIQSLGMGRPMRWQRFRTMGATRR